ncbi:MAG: pyridoxamine 5'-phosphate oxidase family protein [Pseudonocardiaceae bacterium]|nr:MAG: pyridoxamine 5'-phosphate oxidase family protein [Pseudonocardiaceae bacterium]
MSELLDPVVPDGLRRELADDHNEGFTLALLTVADGGWPHQALISIGEVVVLDDARLRLATWPTSTTTRNMLATGRSALVAVVDGAVLTVRLSLTACGTVETLQVFDARIVEVRSDAAPYATVETGIRFRLTDPAQALARWRSTREALRDMP